MSVILTDAKQADYRITFVNKAFSAQTGYSSAEALGKNCRFLQGRLTDQSTVASIRHALANGLSIQCEILNYRKNGEQYWNYITIDPVRNAADEVVQFISFQRDGTSERKATTGWWAAAEEQLSSVIDNLPGYIFQRVMHADRTISYPILSRSIFRILGLPEETDWSGDQLIRHVHPADRTGFLKSIIESGVDLTPLRSEFRILTPSGGEHWFRSDSNPRTADAGAVVWEGLAIDVTAEKLSELKLTYLAHHDILTGLANRQLFRTAVVDAIVESAAAVQNVTLFYIDIDEFQVLNEELGQAFGDLVLQEVGRRLLMFASSRGGKAARLGGDEFALLLTPTQSGSSTSNTLQAISLDLLRTMSVAEREISIVACVGAVNYHDYDDPLSCSPAERASELMKRADLALRRAKQDGAGSCCIYSAKIDDRVQNRIALRRSLHEGVASKQFQLHYQPLVELRTGNIVGAEALVRWDHPELGMQRPDLFIPYAESSGLIVPLGAWVMKHAMKQAQNWRSGGISVPRIAINLSGVQLQRPGFLAAVVEALDETGARPCDFEFELTERTIIGASNAIRTQLDSLRELGFGLAIDDFGTGHSTLKSLRDFPISKIKIDQTFVRQLVVDSSDASIIRAIMALSYNLKLDVVAEGIETIMQRDFLMEEGCKVGQGYLMSLPLTADDFCWLLTSGNKLLPVEVSGSQTGLHKADQLDSV